MCHAIERVSLDDPCVVLTLDIPLPIPGCLHVLADGKPQLASRHRQELRASGLSDGLIADSNIRTVSGAEVCRMLNWSQDPSTVGSGWAIPFDDADADDCYWRVKLDQPRTREDHTIKYESPVGSSNRAYLPPDFDDVKGKPIIITEGEKKALSAASHGMNCLGVTGTWNWQKPRKRDDSGRGFGSRHLIDDLAAINWRDREVVICFDSDAFEKHSVELAQQRLAEALAKRGAKVQVARLPGGQDGSKLGLDDAIVQLGIDKVREILDSAEEPELPKLSWPDLARMLIEDRWSHSDESKLRLWRGTFWLWNGRYYEEITDDFVKNEIYRFLERIGWNPKRSAVAEVAAALRAEVELLDSFEPPCFVDQVSGATNEVPLVFADSVALIDFDTWDGNDLPTSPDISPAFFCTSARSYPYDPGAGCPTWMSFLESSLPDSDSRYLLQQWFGYVLSGRLDWQKLLILLGAPRAGKSIVANTLTQVVGESATATSTLKALGENFGLWPLLGKQLLLLPDAQDRGSCISAVERIKAISGCDGLSVDRKHKPILTNVRLQTRIVIACNQLPRFIDPSGALHRRLLIVNFPVSFAGREDRTLPAKIKQELPGVFNWALQGWLMLQGMGKFFEPDSSREILAEAEQVFSPISAFLEDCCEIGGSMRVEINDVWAAWQHWCKLSGIQPGSRNKLGVDLRACIPGIRRIQLRLNGLHTRVYDGFQLNIQGKAFREQWKITSYRRA